jgi:hypothetical protein
MGISGILISTIFETSTTIILMKMMPVKSKCETNIFEMELACMKSTTDGSRASGMGSVEVASSSSTS